MLLASEKLLRKNIYKRKHFSHSRKSSLEVVKCPNANKKQKLQPNLREIFCISSECCLARRVHY